jgi:hypothetical protein
VTDINLLGSSLGSSSRCQRNRSHDARHLYDRHARGGMGVQGHPE